MSAKSRKKSQTKKRKEKTRRALQFGSSGERTRTIDVEEVEQFDITFRVPRPREVRKIFRGMGKDAQRLFEEAARMAQKDGETLSQEQVGALEEMAYAVAKMSLVSWTLDIPCTPENIDGIENLDVVLDMLLTIMEDFSKAKN